MAFIEIVNLKNFCIEVIVMKDSYWIKNGTTSFLRWDGINSTVIPATSVFYAMFKPKVLEYYYEPDWINYIVNYLCENFKYNKELLNNVEVKVKPLKSPNNRDLSVVVSSVEKKNVKHKSALMSLLFAPFDTDIPTREDIIKEAKNWRVLDYSCGCGRGTSIDEYCSMPYDYCAEWEITPEDYSRSFKDETLPKFYGKVLCKHEASGLVESGRYRVFNMDEFVLMLPMMMRSLNYASRDGEKLSQKEMDIALNPFIQELGFGEIRNYIKKLYNQDRELRTHEERLIRTLGKPKRNLLIDKII